VMYLHISDRLECEKVVFGLLSVFAIVHIASLTDFVCVWYFRVYPS
jgi:hypothetical protein